MSKFNVIDLGLPFIEDILLNLEFCSSVEGEGQFRPVVAVLFHSSHQQLYFIVKGKLTSIPPILFLYHLTSF